MMISGLRALPWAIAVFLSLAAAASKPACAQEQEASDEPPVLERVAPAYPESLAHAGVEGEVRLSVLVSESGTVADVHVLSGLPEFAGAAEAAVRRWRFRPPVVNGVPQRVWIQVPVRFELDSRTASGGNNSSVVESDSPAAKPEYVQNLPEVVFRVPLCGAIDESTLVGPTSRGRSIHVLVGKDGRVQRAVWTDPSPHSMELQTRAKHWLFRPARDDHDAPVAVWVALPIPHPPCDSLMDRPDTEVLEALAEADSLHVSHAGAAFSIVATPGDRAANSGGAHAVAQRVRSWLEDERAFEGAGPWVTDCVPAPDWTLEFAGSRGAVRLDIATACAWMQVTQRGRLLFVPYEPIRDDVKALLTLIESTPVGRHATGRNR
jgi:TonB family protein